MHVVISAMVPAIGETRSRGTLELFPVWIHARHYMPYLPEPSKGGGKGARQGGVQPDKADDWDFITSEGEG